MGTVYVAVFGRSGIYAENIDDLCNLGCVYYLKRIGDGKMFGY